jgi:cytochrome c-type biogenesis protein CcmH
VVVAIGVPLIAASLYSLLGSPLALESTTVHAPSSPSIETMVESLAVRLKTQPDNLEGWHMLARSYSTLGRYRQASEAYEHLLTKTPNDPDLLADYADILAMVLNQSLQGRPERVITRALEIDPNHIKALALAGSAAFERQDFRAAIRHWEKILKLAPPDSEIARSTLASLAEARQLSGERAAPAKEAKAVEGSGDASQSVQGMVELVPSLKGKVPPDATVFVFARAAEGPGMPLAALRMKVSELPARFLLDDTLAITPQNRLSTRSSVTIGARLSRSGSATPAQGDAEIIVKDVALGARNVRLVIGVAQAKAE